MNDNNSSTLLILFDCFITLLCIKDCIQCCKDCDRDKDKDKAKNYKSLESEASRREAFNAGDRSGQSNKQPSEPLVKQPS